MPGFKKIFKDNQLKNLINEYDSLRANFNNSNNDYVSFDYEANELQNKFVRIHDEYCDSLRHLIDGYIFNIKDFIIRNKRLMATPKVDEDKIITKRYNEKNLEVKNSSTIVFSNNPLPNVKKDDEE